MGLLLLRYAPSTKMAMLFLTHATASIYNVRVNVYMTATIPAVHDVCNVCVPTHAASLEYNVFHLRAFMD